MTRTLRVCVPATTANLGPGFDALGLALDLWNEALFTRRTDTQVIVTITDEGADSLPTDAQNIIATSARRTFQLAGQQPLGLTIACHNRIPLSSGLGSSAAAVLTGIVGANALMGAPLNQDAVLKLAVTIEGHPDNVAPALLGGLVVCLADGEGIIAHKMEMTANRKPVHITLALPEFELSTKSARAALPAQVPHADAVFNLSRAVLVCEALTTGNLDLLAAAMHDRLHQPYRLPLIPGAQEAIEAARGAGAASAVLSGAGPSVAAFSAQQDPAIGTAMQQAFAHAGLTARVFQLGISEKGADVTAIGD